MLTIHHAPGARSLRVLWLCEEMGLAYETRAASFMQPSDEFKALNPLRTIPTLQDGDVTMIESVAMMLYIIGKYGPTDLEVKPDDPAYADYLQYMLFAEAGLSVFCNPLIATKSVAPEDQKSNWTADFLGKTIERRLKFIDQRLAGKTYIAGDRFTAADISLVYAGLITKFVGFADAAPKGFADYCARMMERPAYQRAASVK